VKSFGMHQQIGRSRSRLHWISVAKQGGPELYQDIYGGMNFYWELQDGNPDVKRYVDSFQKKFGTPPGEYGVYAYSAILEVARGSELAKTTDAERSRLRCGRARPTTTSGQAVVAHLRQQVVPGHVDPQGPRAGQDEGRLGPARGRVARAANEEVDRTCAEKGFA